MNTRLSYCNGVAIFIDYLEEVSQVFVRKEIDRLLLIKILEIAKAEGLNLPNEVAFRKMAPKWFSFGNNRNKLWINHEMAGQNEEFIVDLMKAVDVQNKNRSDY